MYIFAQTEIKRHHFGGDMCQTTLLFGIEWFSSIYYFVRRFAASHFPTYIKRMRHDSVLVATHSHMSSAPNNWFSIAPQSSDVSAHPSLCHSPQIFSICFATRTPPLWLVLPFCFPLASVQHSARLHVSLVSHNWNLIKWNQNANCTLECDAESSSRCHTCVTAAMCGSDYIANTHT